LIHFSDLANNNEYFRSNNRYSWASRHLTTLTPLGATGLTSSCLCVRRQTDRGRLDALHWEIHRHR